MMSTKAELRENANRLAEHAQKAMNSRFKRLKVIVGAEIVLVGGIAFLGYFTKGTGYISLALGIVALFLAFLIFKEDKNQDDGSYKTWYSSAERYFKASGVDVASLSPSLESNYILSQVSSGTIYPGEVYDGHGKVNGEYSEIELRIDNNGDFFLMSAGKEISPR
jgi:hypothetical protein